MPSNESFIPPFIERFLAWFNNNRRNEAEIALDQATAAIPQTMDIPNIVQGQAISMMEVPSAEANFLALETRLLGRQHDTPMKILDIGTFTGRSAMAMAQAMPHGGKVISCDYTDKYEALAKDHWEKAGVADRIDFRKGPAADTLQQLLANGEAGTFDLVFVDADKPGYDQYYEDALKLLRPGGLVILDNMLWSGRVAKDDVHDPNTDALRALNEKIRTDERVDPVLLGFEDGVLMAEKRDPEHFANMAKSSRTEKFARR